MVMSWNTRIKQMKRLEKLCCKDGAKGIDIGCGMHKICDTAIGVDFTTAHGRTPDVMSMADDLPMFKDNELDYVVNCHLLEHLADTKKALKEWYRVLKSGGYLGISIPHGELDHSAIYTIEHLSGFTPKTLELFMHWSGFDVTHNEVIREPEKGSRWNILCVGNKNPDRVPRYVVDTERYKHK